MIDQENQGADEEMLALVGDAFYGVHLEQDAADVMARGRTLRRRKRAMPALGALGILTLSASVALALPASSGGNAKSLAYNGAVVNVDNAAFSVHTDAKTGQITMTFRQFYDESELKQVLAEAGINAVFQDTSVPSPVITSALSGFPVNPCTWMGVQRLDSSGVLGEPREVNGTIVITLNPAKMPRGSVLGFEYLTYRTAFGGRDGNYGSTDVVVPALLSGEPTGCVLKSPN